VADGEAVGVVTSGSFGPSVERPIGMAYVPPAFAEDGTVLGIGVRGRTVEAQVCPLPFWPHRTKRIGATGA
jgi:aminomethyltransferase